MAYPDVLPALIDALVTRAKAEITAATVYDGIGYSDDPGDYLMIGVDDPDGPNWANAATGTRDWETVGLDNDIDEIGDITCAAFSWNGDGDPKAARDAVYATAEAVAGICRATPTMGLDRLLWVLYGGNWQFMQGQDEFGAKALFEFQLHFRALI